MRTEREEDSERKREKGEKQKHRFVLFVICGENVCFFEDNKKQRFFLFSSAVERKTTLQ